MPKVVYTTIEGLVTSAGAGFTVTDGPLSHGSETVTNAAATSPSKPLSLMNCTAASPVTALAAGTAVGQLKHCVCTGAAGTQQDLTPAGGLLGGLSTVVRFNVVGMAATLVRTGTLWAVLDRAGGDNSGSTGATAVHGYAIIA